MKRMVNRRLPFALVLFLWSVLSARAQNPSSKDSLEIPTLPPEQRVPFVTGEDVRPASFTMTKSPGFAVGLSALLPGAGQFYNESYWKIPIVVGLGGYFVSGWIRNDNLAEDYRIQYEASKTEEIPSGDTRLLSTRDFYKNQRDTFVWYFVILYVANLVDAYVDANLYDFDVGEDLTLRVLPEIGSVKEETFRLGLKVLF